MKRILLIVLIILLAGCKSASVKVTDPETGLKWDIKYTVLGNSELEEVDAGVGDVTFQLGKSSNDTPTGTDRVLDAFIGGRIAPVLKPQGAVK